MTNKHAWISLRSDWSNICILTCLQDQNSYTYVYISIFKIHKKFKYLTIKNYLTLPMLLLEGERGLYHHGNPSQHMETAPVLETTTPIKGRSHHHIHSALNHLLPSRGRYLPIYSAQADEEKKLVGVLQGSIPTLSLEEGNQYARISKVLPPSSLAVRELFSQNRDNSQAPII